MNDNTKLRCFLCNKPMIHPREADTRDGQIVLIGPECLKHVLAAGDKGYGGKDCKPGYVKVYPLKA